MIDSLALTSHRITLHWTGLLGIALLGCGTPAEQPDLVLAQVGPKQITPSEFLDFKAKIHIGMRKGDTPVEVNRDLLESLIDKTLLVLEAEDANIGSNPWFVNQLKRFRRSKLMALYHLREVLEKVALTREEIEEHFHKTYRDRAIRLAGIMTETRPEAIEIISKLQAGADFHQLAVDHSIHEETAPRGGDTGIYQVRDDLTSAAAELVAHLGVGEISEPLPFPYSDGRTTFIVFKVLDEIPVPLEAAEPRIREELLLLKRAERIAALVDSLGEAYSPQVHVEHLAALSRHFADAQGEGDLPDSLSRLILCVHKGGEVTVGDFVLAVNEVQIGTSELGDTSRVAYLLDHLVLPEHYLMKEIEQKGYDRDPELLATVERKRGELMLIALRRHAVDRYVDTTDEEARSFYDDHPEKFREPKTAVAVEILVDSDSLARRIRKELLSGAEAEELALRYTQREGAQHHDGKIRLNKYTRSFFPGIFEMAEQMEIGEVGGPVRVSEGYSVFKIVDRHHKLKPFDDESLRRARAYVKIDKAKKGYVKYVRGLRQKYPVEIFEENLAEVTGSEQTAT